MNRDKKSVHFDKKYLKSKKGHFYGTDKSFSSSEKTDIFDQFCVAQWPIL